jgi:hypothetical protein
MQAVKAGRPAAPLPRPGSPMATPAPSRGHRRPRRACLPILLLSAACIVAACGGADNPPPRTEQPPAAPEPLTPRGAVSLPFSFTWKPVSGDWIYRIIVTDAAERFLLQQDLRNGSALPAPAELQAMMAERHATFNWSVAIVTPDGRSLAQSPPVAFSLK